MSELLRAPTGAVDLAAVDARATPGFEGGKADAERERPRWASGSPTLQEQLYAEGRKGGARSLLLVLQGMDTSGKGGTVHARGRPRRPGGVHVASFGKPTEEELAHDFLWRIRAPAARARARSACSTARTTRTSSPSASSSLADRRTSTRRFGAINRFEEELAAAGTAIVKCFLHISRDEQRERLLARLDDPTKHWKYNPGDLDDRGRVGRLHGGLRRRDRALQHRGRALVRRPGRSQVVPELGGDECC